MSAYLDHAAAAPMGEPVRRALDEALELVGSPGSVHEWGRAPAELLERARQQVAALVGGAPEEIIFTSGATEARNLAIKGLASANRRLGNTIVISAVEHPATLAAARSATRGGGELVEIGVNEEGLIDARSLAAVVGSRTSLVCLPVGQGDIGTLQPLEELVGAVRGRREEARIHLDAGDCAGRVPLDVAALGCDALTLGAWPLGAPPWVGALWLREGARLTPLIEGGIQEHGKRSGAENLPAIAALGAAAELARERAEDRIDRLRALADRLIDGLLAVEEVRLNGPRERRIPGHVQVSVGDVEAETLVLGLSTHGVAASPGSACTAYAGKAAPALEAIGLREPWTQSAVLFTLGDPTTEQEIDRAIAAFAEVVARYRGSSAVGR
jgi:cysteine desulfurase